MSISGRVFVKSGGLALFSLGLDPLFLARAAFGSYRPLPSSTAADRPVLVCLFQRGAVDGLNMVVPHGESLYYRERPRIAVPASDVVDLDGHFGLHPQLAALKPLWDNKSLGVIHAVGSPDSTRSHFDAQDYMESGTPGVKSTTDGWLARAVAARPAKSTPFRAVAIAPALPRTLQGDVGAISMQSLDRFDVRTGDDGTARQGFESLYEQGVRDLLHGTGRETFDAVKMLRSAQASRIAPAHGAEYPRVPLGEALRQIAQLIKANVGLEVAFADMQGWDTHVGQGAERGQLALRLRDFGAAPAAFAQDLGHKMSDLVVLTMSEFGRTVAENGNRGTDHGHATAMLLLGGGVRGGKVYGRWPGLARERLYEGRDLAVTTDFRALFSEVAGRQLGIAKPATLFPGWSGGSAVGVMS